MEKELQRSDAGTRPSRHSTVGSTMTVPVVELCQDPDRFFFLLLPLETDAGSPLEVTGVRRLAPGHLEDKHGVRAGSHQALFLSESPSHHA